MWVGGPWSLSYIAWYAKVRSAIVGGRRKERRKERAKKKEEKDGECVGQKRREHWQKTPRGVTNRTWTQLLSCSKSGVSVGRGYSSARERVSGVSMVGGAQSGHVRLRVGIGARHFVLFGSFWRWRWKRRQRRWGGLINPTRIQEQVQHLLCRLPAAFVRPSQDKNLGASYCSWISRQETFCQGLFAFGNEKQVVWNCANVFFFCCCCLLCPGLQCAMRIWTRRIRFFLIPSAVRRINGLLMEDKLLWHLVRETCYCRVIRNLISPILLYLTADPGGPGICAFILTLFSFLLILATFPLSLCFSVKVRYSFTFVM